MLRRLAPFAVALLASLYFLFSPASGVPFLPPGMDKLGHCALFAALALTGRWARFAQALLAAGLVAYAVTSEFLQAALPINRDGSVADGVADVVGIAIGLWLATRARR